MSILFLRTFILYFITLFALKAMGKRQLGQLQPFELVILLIISEMASLAMQSSTTPIVYSIIPIVTLSLLQILLASLNLRYASLRNLFCGKPVLIVEQGRLCQKTMAKLRININDLQELSRAQGYFDLSAIDYAIMETNGSLSILPKTPHRPLEAGDVLSPLPEEFLPRLLILDGHINRGALSTVGKNVPWLEKQLRECGAGKAEEIFLAGLDDRGQFFYQKKQIAGKKPPMQKKTAKSNAAKHSANKGERQ